MKKDEIVLECNRVSAGYKRKVVLKDINFALPAGSLSVMIGPNGSGKSTLLRTVCGQQPPLAGCVSIMGENVADYSPRRLAFKRSLVDTGRSGGGGLTVEEAVAVGRYSYTGWAGLMSAEDKNIVNRALADVGMESFRDRQLATLSDGERQKVMVARALAQETPLIVLDEPTAFLDVAARVEMMRLLRCLGDAGKTIVLSTHDIAPALAVADRIIVVNPHTHSVCCGLKNEIIDSCILDAAFAASGLRFDKNILDFR